MVTPKEKGGAYKCKLCPCSYTFATGLTRHMKDKHPQAKEPVTETAEPPAPETALPPATETHRCPLCQREFSKRRGLSERSMVSSVTRAWLTRRAPPSVASGR